MPMSKNIILTNIAALKLFICGPYGMTERQLDDDGYTILYYLCKCLNPKHPSL